MWEVSRDTCMVWHLWRTPVSGTAGSGILGEAETTRNVNLRIYWSYLRWALVFEVAQPKKGLGDVRMTTNVQLLMDVVMRHLWWTPLQALKSHRWKKGPGNIKMMTTKYQSKVGRGTSENAQSEESGALAEIKMTTNINCWWLWCLWRTPAVEVAQLVNGSWVGSTRQQTSIYMDVVPPVFEVALLAKGPWMRSKRQRQQTSKESI